VISTRQDAPHAGPLHYRESSLRRAAMRVIAGHVLPSKPTPNTRSLKPLWPEAKRRNLPTLHAADFEALPVEGHRHAVNGKSVIIGGPRLLTEAKVTVPSDVEK